MQLHQLLRYLDVKLPIVIVDINNVVICKVASKTDINHDLYEEEVIYLSAGIVEPFDRPGLGIMLQK